MDLFSCLKSVGRAVYKKYPYINSGGCCVYASAIATELKKLGIECRIVVCSSYVATTIDDARKQIHKSNRGNLPTVDDWNSNCVYMDHVIVEFFYNGKVYHYDTDLLHKATNKFHRMSVLSGRLTIEEATFIASTASGWNTAFNRKDIPDIMVMIKDAFALVSTQGNKPWYQTFFKGIYGR